MQRPCLLLIEDDKPCQLVATALAERRGWNVRIASAAQEGLEILEREPISFDLILMDWRLPDMDGLECTRRIRELEAGAGKRVPIIGVTANAMVGDREKCLAAGMDDYLSKPFHIEDFHAIISKWLDRQ